jgi:hypothetical protein
MLGYLKGLLFSAKALSQHEGSLFTFYYRSPHVMPLTGISLRDNASMMMMMMMMMYWAPVQILVGTMQRYRLAIK